MKSFSIVSIFFSAVFAAVAQTNTNMDAGAPRAMSLQDCIQQALQHNLDVQIERYNPQISLYNLNAAYGGYDPTFSISGQHSYDKSGPDGFPPSVSDGKFLQFRPRRVAAVGVAI